MGNLLSRARGLKDKPPTYPYAAPYKIHTYEQQERTRNTKPKTTCPELSRRNRRTLTSTSPSTQPTGASLGRVSLFPGPRGEEALQGRERRLDVPRLRLHEGTHLCVLRAIGRRVRTAEAVSDLARHGSMLQVTPNETQRRRSTGRATRALK